MKCLVVDDEPIAREILESYITDMPGLSLVGSCNSALQAMEVLKKQSVDLMFLDVNMPRLSGIELLRTLESYPAIVLTTAYPDYALQGYELDVVDYLLKPFSFERFLKAVQKVESRVLVSVGATRQLIVKSDKKTWPIEMDDIRFVESIGDYVNITTVGRKILVHETLKNIEESLPRGQFFRVHKSWIVSRGAIEFIEGNYIMSGTTSIPIGKSFKDEFMIWLNK
ncbi:MAG TPA: DNA-binding response regulator [Bacteroidetes bacterium]|nr:DNA-binding response regulator [Bacteroidota bacterium]